MPTRTDRPMAKSGATRCDRARDAEDRVSEERLERDPNSIEAREAIAKFHCLRSNYFGAFPPPDAWSSLEVAHRSAMH